MDYKRIYDEFIKSRRAREASLSGYRERHHIVPRSFGGGNEPENLIDLSPEDHFFAHLLLAKIHGGQMWAPVAFMVGGSRKDYRPIVSRHRYGWVLNAMAASKRGAGAYQFDSTIYELEHADGRRWRGLQSEMPSLGFSRAMANLLVKRRCKSAKGWFLNGERPRHVGRGLGGGKAHHAYKPEVYQFLHVDGRRFQGTQFDLQTHAGLHSTMASRLVRGEFRCTKGWYIEGRPPAKRGRGAAYKVAVSAEY